jgi:amino acid transporter
VVVGPDKISQAAQQDPAVVFSVMETVFGPILGGALAGLGRLLQICSMFAAMLAFHNVVARNLYALGREGVAPRWFARTGTGRRDGAPVAGSLGQSVIAAIVVMVFVVVGADPVAILFTWLATLAAVGVLCLLVTSCLAAVRFFARQRRLGARLGESVWIRIVGPLAGFAVGLVVLAVTTVNLHALLGLKPGSAATALIPAIVALFAIAGLGWALWLRRKHPEVYRGVGAGKPHPLAVLDARLADVEV